MRFPSRQARRMRHCIAWMRLILHSTVAAVVAAPHDLMTHEGSPSTTGILECMTAETACHDAMLGRGE